MALEQRGEIVLEENMVRRRGGALRVAIGLLAVGGVIGGVSVAAAAERADETVKAVGTAWDKPAVSVTTGDTVTWDIDSGDNQFHNAQGEDGPDDAWKGKVIVPLGTTGKGSFTFTKPGEYGFRCLVHAGMTGKVTVTGDPVTPTPTPSSTPTAEPTTSPVPTRTATPTATAPPVVSGSDRTTPAPLGASRGDVTAPVVSKLKLKAVAHGARVSFTLSETSTVTIRFKRGKRAVRTIKLSTRAGSRSFTVRSSQLVRARYTVEVEARDARGNQAAVQSAKVRVSR
jgi:plastocyanin